MRREHFHDERRTTSISLMDCHVIYVVSVYICRAKINDSATRKDASRHESKRPSDAIRVRQYSQVQT